MERRVTSHTEEEEMNQRRQLLELARKGDQKAVGTLMELYQVRVYSGENLRRVRPSRPSSSPSKSKPSKLPPQKPAVTSKLQPLTPVSKRKVEGRKSSVSQVPALKKSSKRAKVKVTPGTKVTKKPASKTTKAKPSRARPQAKATRVSKSKVLRKDKVSSIPKRPSKSKIVGKSKAVIKKPVRSKVKTSSKSKAGSRPKTMSKARNARPASKSKVSAQRRGR